MYDSVNKNLAPQFLVIIFYDDFFTSFYGQLAGTTASRRHAAGRQSWGAPRRVPDPRSGLVLSLPNFDWFDVA